MNKVRRGKYYVILCHIYCCTLVTHLGREGRRARIWELSSVIKVAGQPVSEKKRGNYREKSVRRGRKKGAKKKEN